MIISFLTFIHLLSITPLKIPRLFLIFPSIIKSYEYILYICLKIVLPIEEVINFTFA